MRRYGTYQYGATQYGEGTISVRCQDVFTTNDNFRLSSTRSIKVTDLVQFSDNLRSNVLREAFMLDQFKIEDDIRLKYVRVNYASAIQFSDRIGKPDLLSVARAVDHITFSESYTHIILMKNVTWVGDIWFDDSFWARHNWEPIPNPYDDIWTPKPMPLDVWVPRTSPADNWTPRELNNG